MAQPSAIAPILTEGVEKYRLTSPVEVIFVLRALIKRKELVTVYFNEGQDFILTTLLDIDLQTGTLIFDRGGDEVANQRFLRSRRQVFVAAPDGIKVQFATSQIGEFKHAGQVDFLTRLPDELLRLQRREYYRAKTPMADPPVCFVPDHPAGNIEVPVYDISIGGVGLYLHNEALEFFEVYRVYPDCRIDLKDLGTVVSSLEVRYVNAIQTVSGNRIGRAGCRFGPINAATQAVLQRYVVTCERDRIAFLR